MRGSSTWHNSIWSPDVSTCQPKYLFITPFPRKASPSKSIACLRVFSLCGHSLRQQYSSTLHLRVCLVHCLLRSSKRATSHRYHRDQLRVRTDLAYIASSRPMGSRKGEKSASIAIPILILSPGQQPPIQSWKRSNDFVKEFLGRDTRFIDHFSVAACAFPSFNVC